MKNGDSFNKWTVIASVVPDGCLAYHSALDFLGYQTQIFNHVQIASPTRFRPFSFEYENYTRVHDIPRIDINKYRINGKPVFCPSLSQTIIDCLKRPDLSGGMEEIMNVFLMLTPDKINFRTVTKVLNVYNSKSLWQRAGYLFELFGEETHPPKDFLSLCRYCTGNTHGTIRDFGDKVYVNKWNLFVPSWLDNLTINGIKCQPLPSKDREHAIRPTLQADQPQ